MIKDSIKGIQHIGIPTENMNATIAFYEKIGFEPIYETLLGNDRVVFLKLSDIVIEAYEVEHAAAVDGGIDHLALNVTGIDQLYTEICNLGLNNLNDEIHFLPFFEKGVRYFIIQGPNHERVEFNEYVR